MKKSKSTTTKNQSINEAPLPTDVKRLQAALLKSQLHAKLLNAIIDIAEEELNIDIRKKSGTTVELVEQSMPRSINELCSLLGYSRQSYYQGKICIQQKAYESDIIIEEVLAYRKLQKRLGTRKLLEELQPFLKAHDFQIGRDAFFFFIVR